MKFSLSKSFKLYMTEHNIDDSRTSIADSIVDYGRTMISKHPRLEKLLCFYFANDLDAVYECIHQLPIEIARLDNIVQNINHCCTILSELSFPYGTNDQLSISLTCNYDYDCFKLAMANASKACILGVIESEKTYKDNQLSVMSSIEKRLKQYNTKIGGRFVHDMYEAYNSCRNTYNCKKHYNNDFDQLLIEHGYKTTNIWNNQSTFNIHAIHFLLQNQDLIQNIDQCFNSSLKNKVHEEFGLICGSGDCCELGICQLPSLVDWTIKENDGSETVHIL